MSELSPTESPHEPQAQVPDSIVLTAALSSVLTAAGCTSDPITILDREKHIYASSYPSEVVTCRTADGSILRLLCKYSVEVDRHLEFGHRRGIAHEAEVYRSVLRAPSLTVPRYYGTYDDPTTGSTCLVMEYLDGAYRSDEAEAGLLRAAQWLGHFHAINERRTADQSLAFLPRYDLAYYRGWIDRTIQFASPITESFSWLSELQLHADEIVNVLQAAPLTVVHGEYYSPNVLFRDGVIFPVDWESAAIGAGELDVASLTQAWEELEVRACEQAYCRARWPEGAPDTFSKTLQAARIYFLVRWLGEDPGWTTLRGHGGTHKELRRQMERWGVTI